MDKISLSLIYLPDVRDKFILFHCMLGMTEFMICVPQNRIWRLSKFAFRTQYALVIAAFYMDIFWALKLLKQTFWRTVK